MRLSDLYKYLIENYINLPEKSVVVLAGLIKAQSANKFEDYEHIEELSLEVRKHGSYPMLDISSESLKIRTLKEVPEEKYYVPSDYYSNWVSLFDLIIDVGFPKFNNLKAEMVYGETKKQDIDDSIQQIFRHLLISGKKMLIPNFPKDSLADYYNLDLISLTNFYLNTFQMISQKMVTFSMRVVGLLENTITTKFSIQDNEDMFIHFEANNEEIVNETDTFSNTITYLPFGYVKCTSKSSSLNCHFVAERFYYKNRIWTNVEVKFSDGNLTYLKFENPEIEQEFVKTSLINRRDLIEVYIGTNNGVEDFSNYNYYDRCIQNNLSIVFYDEEYNLIQISTNKIKI